MCSFKGAVQIFKNETVKGYDRKQHLLPLSSCSTVLFLTVSLSASVYDFPLLLSVYLCVPMLYAPQNMFVLFPRF